MRPADLTPLGAFGAVGAAAGLIAMVTDRLVGVAALWARRRTADGDTREQLT